MDSPSSSRSLSTRPDEVSLPGARLEPSGGLTGYRPRRADSRDADALITPQFVWRVFGQWWYIALPTSLALAALSGVLVIVLFTPVYRATAVLQISSHAPYIAYESREPVQKSEEFVQTQIELLKSPLVLEQVLLQPTVAELPEIREQSNAMDWLRHSVKVVQVGHSELYEVFLDSPDPGSGAELINGVLDAYFDIRSRDDASRTKRVIELLNQEKGVRGREVQRLREQMRQLSQETVGVDPFTEMPAGRGDGRLHPLQTLQEQMTKSEVERKVLEVEIQALEEAIAAEKPVSVPAVQVEMALDDSAEIRELRALIATKKATLHRVESAAAQGRQDPSYRRLEREIVSYERSLELAVKGARPNMAAQLQSMAVLDREDALARLQVQLESQLTLARIYQERFDEQLKAVNASGNKSLELEFTRAELAREEKVFELIAERSMALSTEMRAPGRVTLLRQAQPPRMPVEKIPLRNLALAVLASGSLPFGFILLWELSVRRISTVDQLAEHSHLSILGEVAKLPARARIGVRGGRDVSVFEESVDSLRVCLFMAEQHQPVQVLSVMSAVQGEGKTSVASQLAASIARSTGQPTLLIDGDMRSPDIHEIFNIPHERGLAQVLSADCTFDEAVVTTWSDYLHLLPAGKLRKSPHKVLGGNRLENLLQELRGRYAHIVIDTPPVLSASESLLLAKVADRTLLCARRNYSRERQVRLAYERLTAAGTRPLGAVFNAVPTRQYVHTYGSYDYVRKMR